ESSNGNIRLGNIAGQLVYSSAIDTKAVQTINVSELRAGLYFLHVTSDSGNSG
ncbi:T9SS type A sorting domain-containing protein, partial [Hymenobacter sp. IS2118]|uniref:T9SS type A sorting domain-containing protein n=1 Tax=Hymenobacter sp. IS2118 TaxID=1505605 RepID=UPI0012693041